MVRLVLGLNLGLCVFTWLLLGADMTGFGKSSRKRERINPTCGFVLSDLPLPAWARGFMLPIDGAAVPQTPNLLPGAAREYRNGVHQGVDFFSPMETPVRAAKEGHVLSVDRGYRNIPADYRNRLLRYSNQLYRTPPEILDLLHGRRVVLGHGMTGGHWVATVYSHLCKIKKGLEVGDWVDQGEVIGYVGNSGTSHAGTDQGTHLHFEIRVDGHYLSEGMVPSQVRNLYKTVLERRQHHDKPHGQSRGKGPGKGWLRDQPSG